jgi:hypothetical protein
VLNSSLFSIDSFSLLSCQFRWSSNTRNLLSMSIFVSLFNNRNSLGVVGKVSTKDQAPPGCRWVEIYSADNEGKVPHSDRDEMRRKDDFYQFLRSFFSWKILREVHGPKSGNFLTVEVLVPLTSLEAAPEGPDRRRSFLGTCSPHIHVNCFTAIFVFCFSVSCVSQKSFIGT